VLKQLAAGMREAMERHGWSSLEDSAGCGATRVVVHSKIRRADSEAYRGGYAAEGYAARRTRRGPPNARRRSDESGSRRRRALGGRVATARCEP
jgi:hypothetical protein